MGVFIFPFSFVNMKINMPRLFPGSENNFEKNYGLWSHFVVTWISG